MWIRRCPLTWLALLAALLGGAGGGVGCSRSKLITITTDPPGAMLRIDKVDRGRAPITQEFAFASDRDYHVVHALSKGYVEQTYMITSEESKPKITIKLQPVERDLTFRTNVPASFSVDGRRVTVDPVTFYEAKKIAMGIDPKTNIWKTHTIVAEAPGYQRAQQTVSWLDQTNQYDLTLRPLEKDVSVTTSPPGAQVFIDDKLVGTTADNAPAVAERVTFEVNENNQFVSHKLRAVKPGYDPVERDLNWDDGAKEYHVELAPKSKTIRLASDPPGATFKLDNKDLSADSSGAVSTTLQFIPDDKGELPLFTGWATKSGDKDYRPTLFTVGWDDGQKDYTVKLKEVPTRQVPLLTAT